MAGKGALFTKQDLKVSSRGLTTTGCAIETERGNGRYCRFLLMITVGSVFLTGLIRQSTFR